MTGRLVGRPGSVPGVRPRDSLPVCRKGTRMTPFDWLFPICPRKSSRIRSRRTVHLLAELLEPRLQPSASPTTVEPINGSGNNLLHPTWGSDGTDLLRIAPAAYA